MKTLGDIMRPGFLFTVQRDQPVAHAVRVMSDNNIGIVIVLDGDRLAGVFSERDVVRRVVDWGRDPVRVAVGDVMTPDVIVADVDDDYRSAIRTMDDANIRHLLVASEGRLLSMLSIRDLIRVDREERNEEIGYLREYLFQVPAGAV
jgi:CBS domain-containing protein